VKLDCTNPGKSKMAILVRIINNSKTTLPSVLSWNLPRGFSVRFQSTSALIQ
jgi:hypothetical protein